MDLLRERNALKEVPIEEAALDRVVDVGADPETALLKERYRAEFKAAFRAALDELEPKARNLLRYHLVRDLTIDDIAAVYAVRCTGQRRRAGSTKPEQNC